MLQFLLIIWQDSPGPFKGVSRPRETSTIPPSIHQKIDSLMLRIVMYLNFTLSARKAAPETLSGAKVGVSLFVAQLSPATFGAYFGAPGLVFVFR